MRIRWYISVFAVVAGSAAVGGCYKNPPVNLISTQSVTPGLATSPTLVCPTQIPGSKITMTEIRGGVVVDLTGPIEKVEALRAISHVLAARFNTPNGEAPGLRAMEQILSGAGPGSGMGGTGSGKGEKHKMHTGEPEGEGGMTGSGEGSSASQSAEPVSVPPARAITEDLAEGSRLIFVPTDPNQASTLHVEVRRRVEHMRAGNCSFAQPGLDTPY
ncbi:MAG TPA: hypothetical protein VGQ83_37405 [Polyangia bacterium]|jgi:hypothetical protein